MAASTFRGATWTTTAGNKTVTATPAVGDLIVVIAANSGRTTAQPPTITDDNSSGTYTQIVSATKNTSADSCWIFIRNTLITAASSTIFTSTQSSDSGGGLIVYSVTTCQFAGTAASRQSQHEDNQLSGGAAHPVFASNCLTTNVIIGAVFTGTNGSANATPPASWTEDADQGYNTPTSGIEAAHIDSGFTSNSPTWSAQAASAYCDLVVEIDTSKVPYVNPMPQLIAQ